LQVDDWAIETLMCLLLAWPCIINTNNIDNQLDATIMVY